MVVRTMVRKLATGPLIGRTMDRSSLSSSIGQPPRLSSEAKPVPKSSRDTRTPDSASCAKNVVLAARWSRFLAHFQRQHLAGHLLLGAAFWATVAGKPGSATQPARFDRNGHDPSSGGPGPVLDERLPAASGRLRSLRHPRAPPRAGGRAPATRSRTRDAPIGPAARPPPAARSTTRPRAGSSRPPARPAAHQETRHAGAPPYRRLRRPCLAMFPLAGSAPIASHDVTTLRSFVTRAPVVRPRHGGRAEGGTGCLEGPDSRRPGFPRWPARVPGRLPRSRSRRWSAAGC